jgi:hypothetical protein
VARSDRDRRPGPAVRSVDLIASICSLLALGCWLLLLRWYSLFEHYATPGFAFDKIPGHWASPVIRYTALLFLALTLLYGVNYWLLRSAAWPSSVLKAAVIAMVGGAGIINVLLYPVAAIDLFYYINELKLTFSYRQNPYLVTVLPAYESDPFADFGWPLHVPLAYGPAWVLLSGIPTLLVGFDDLLSLLLAYKAYSLLFVILCGVLIAAYQDEQQTRWLAAYTFLANPLIWFEGVANAHNDLLMTCFLLAAVLALKRDSWLAFPLLTLSALIKMFPVVLMPVFALACLQRGWPRRKVLLSVFASLLVALVVLAPFWADGRMVAGMLRGMRFANNLRTASFSSMAIAYLHQARASSGALLAVRLALGGLFLLIALACIVRMPRVEQSLAPILLAFFTLIGSLNTWYLIPTLGLLALERSRAAMIYMFVATALGLTVHQFALWVRFHSDLSPLHQHLIGMPFLPLPIVALVGVELWRGFTRTSRSGGRQAEYRP